MDVKLVRAARQAYDLHCQHRSDLAAIAPEGVVVNRQTLRGQVLYSEHPALLPDECFIPLPVLEAATLPELSAWPR